MVRLICRSPSLVGYFILTMSVPWDRSFISFGAVTSSLPPGLAKRGGNLPPGLEKQLRRNGRLPPGLEKQLYPFPPELERRLPALPPDYGRAFIGGRAVIYNRSTSLILDVFVPF